MKHIFAIYVIFTYTDGNNTVDAMHSLPSRGHDILQYIGTRYT
jgi:hypothetical protein